MPKDDTLVIPPVKNNSPQLVEVITYIREDQALALEMIQLAEQQRGGAGRDQAVLFQEALDLLINTRLRVVRLGKKESKESIDALALPEAESE